MKTIYLAIMEQLESLSALKWIDLDTGQLATPKPSVSFPCALVGIKLPKSKSLTDTIQDCDARITVKLGFDNKVRTAAKTPEVARTASLAVYDIIADVYKILQGFRTENFDNLNRVSQGDEPTKNGLFVYKIEFSTAFEDRTAEQA
jgi:hypothetical protein